MSGVNKKCHAVTDHPLKNLSHRYFKPKNQFPINQLPLESSSSTSFGLFSDLELLFARFAYYLIPININYHFFYLKLPFPLLYCGQFSSNLSVIAFSFWNCRATLFNAISSPYIKSLIFFSFFKLIIKSEHLTQSQL